jgi:hypothetical protein
MTVQIRATQLIVFLANSGTVVPLTRWHRRSSLSYDLCTLFVRYHPYSIALRVNESSLDTTETLFSIINTYRILESEEHRKAIPPR